MTFREKLVVRILLLVARLFCDDPAIAAEIKSLATQVQIAPAPEPAPEP